MRETLYSVCCSAELGCGDTLYSDLDRCPECRDESQFVTADEMEDDKYRPSFAAFRRDVTVEDALGVTCVVMILMLGWFIAGVLA